MTAPCGWCTFPSTGRIRPFRVHRPNWKAECVERCLLRLEGGKDFEVLPILTQQHLSRANPCRVRKLRFWYLGIGRKPDLQKMLSPCRSGLRLKMCWHRTYSVRSLICTVNAVSPSTLLFGNYRHSWRLKSPWYFYLA